jgi:hypothetical protein
MMPRYSIPLLGICSYIALYSIVNYIKNSIINKDDSWSCCFNNIPLHQLNIHDKQLQEQFLLIITKHKLLHPSCNVLDALVSELKIIQYFIQFCKLTQAVYLQKLFNVAQSEVILLEKKARLLILLDLYCLLYQNQKITL